MSAFGGKADITQTAVTSATKRLDPELDRIQRVASVNRPHMSALYTV